MNYKDLEAKAYDITKNLHYDPAELEQKLMEYSYLCFEADKVFLQANEALTIAEDCKKVSFALIVDKQEGKSLAEKERQALISTQWTQVLDSHKELRLQRNEAMLFRDKYRRNFDCIRTLMANRRKEMEVLND